MKFTRDTHIIVVGAGALKIGYEDITVFDKQPYTDNACSTTDEANAASADFHKVMRMSYGEEIEYQGFAFGGC
ncbi:hypothetical protein F5Y05DRAFT_410319 [Hypoxylon sp. FL0543]|nr:hypothetical protein F5Y05DRAFT_410319 [Hypoxylon sp. FL0543]